MVAITRRGALRLATRAVGILVLGSLAGPGIASAAQAGGLKFEIYKDVKGGFRWRLKAANGETVANSQSYKAKASCRNTIDAIKRGAATATVVDSTTAVP